MVFKFYLTNSATYEIKAKAELQCSLNCNASVNKNNALTPVAGLKHRLRVTGQGSCILGQRSQVKGNGSKVMSQGTCIKKQGKQKKNKK